MAAGGRQIDSGGWDMTQELVFLLVGYGAVWLLLFGYLVFVTGRIRSVRDAVQDVRQELDAERQKASE